MLIEITNEKSEEIFNDILFDFTFAKTAQTKPLGIILGGQPGSGKSFLVKEVEDEFQKDLIFISTDDLRLYHPAYAALQQNPETLQNATNLVNPYASAWTEKLIKYCIENKYNIIIDSTMGGNIQAVYDTIDLLQGNQYDFHLRLMAVPALVSKLSVFLRYESQLKEKGFARWTRMEDHDDRFEKIPKVLEQILLNKPPKTIRFYERILATKGTISLKPSQVFVLPAQNSSFLDNFQTSRNQLFENDTGFMINSIQFIAESIKSRNGDLEEFKSVILHKIQNKSNKIKTIITKVIINIS